MIHHLREMAARIRGLFGDRRAERELDDEIETHLRLLAERYIRQGMSEADALRAARRQFGNVTLLKEVNREMRGVRFVDTFFQDLRYGARMLRKNPGISFVAILTLALGIGANSAIFSIVNAVLLRSLPYRAPDRLVFLHQRRPQEGGRLALSADFLQWRDQVKSFEQIAAYGGASVDLTGIGEAERLSAGIVSADLFATLGVAPALGRAFTQAEDMPGGAPVVILSDGLWRRRFGGDPEVIGRAVTLEGKSRTIIGIMPYGFQFPGRSDLWLPLALDAADELKRLHPSIYNISDAPSTLSVLARLKPDVTPEAARADLSVILERQRQAYPHVYADTQISVIGLSESLVGAARPAFLTLFGAVAFVLLIACANVANLLLARSAARQKEMAIRAAVGAGRLRLARQLLTESMLLSLLGGGAGLIAAKWGVKLLVSMTPARIARIEEASVDGRALGFTCAVVLLTGLFAGLFPSLQASRTDVNETLKAQSKAGNTRSADTGRGWIQRMLPGLIILELALALVLLVGEGLMINSFLRLLAVPIGYDPDGVLTLEIELSQTRYPRGSPQRDAYLRESLARIQALPGVQSAALGGLPLMGPWFILPLRIEGRPPFERGKEPTVLLKGGSPGYLQTLGLQMRAGRACGAQDRATKVAIINETLARRFFPNENPIGHRLLIGNDPTTIVGVVGDTRNASMDREVAPEVNTCGEGAGYLIARVNPDQNNPAGLASVATAIRKQVSAIDPNEPIKQVVRMDEHMSNSLAVAGRRYMTLLLGVFAAMALVIATVGVYGVISYAVSQRTHEIGVRMALGAQANDVLRMLIWRGMSLTLIGVALGLAAALAMTRVMKNLLFEVSATDPATFALITLILVGVALIANYIPARRATKIDPLQSLRQE
ncbi:MAG TPA: ABC transporter permease [Blastocatellia bacterium]|nr:ABC transporter permease [Blastocatellia bacterium]